MLNARHLPFAIFLVAATLARPAAADEKQTAKELFEQGVSKMEAKKYDDACPAIQRSLELDPYPGTLFTLAECEALRGRAAAAYARYGEYLALHATLPRDKQQKQGTREKDARSKRADLERLVAQATLILPASAPAGTVVMRDGVTLTESELGAPLVLDPGEYTLTTQAPGGPATDLRVTLGKGEKRTVALEVRLPDAKPTREEKPPAKGTTSGRRVATYVTGGVGVAGLMLGGVTGGLMLAQIDAVNAGCKDAGNGVSVCSEAGAAAGNDAKLFGTIATVGLAAGAALVGVSIVLYATEPRRDKPAAAGLTVGVAPGPMGTKAFVQGSF